MAEVLQSDLVRMAEQLLTAQPSGADERHVREARFDAGLAFVNFRVGDGGLSAPQSAQAAVDAVFTAAGYSDWRDANVIGLGMAAPTLHEYGTAEQRRLLRPLFSGEHVWCQLFSEPGAGSDLASLATSAVRDGDEWIVNGQKVWTSLGHIARYGLLLARTDPSAPKHKGLTYFILDMSLPGVDVRPIRQMTGEAEFNEVFISDVRVPDSMRVGDVGAGWAVALTTLANERTSLGSVNEDRCSGPISQAVTLYQEAARSGPVEPATLDRLIDLWCRAEAARLMNTSAGNDDSVGPRGSLAKLQMAELNQAIYDLCIDLMGPQGILFDSYALTQPTAAGVHGGGEPRRAYLRTLANSIEGGTSEIQRNIIAERLLGLPAEPRADKDLAWNQTRRS
ncbi:Acyl-CoA dehydrogenase family protein [Mycobacterium sp. smrl_JER01]